jgi:hypothetical protein
MGWLGNSAAPDRQNHPATATPTLSTAPIAYIHLRRWRGPDRRPAGIATGEDAPDSDSSRMSSSSAFTSCMV